jgi:peptide deformylase
VILEVIQYGHPVLREKGKRIERVTPELRQLAADMLETMYAENGVGLAAQQVGQALQLTVIDVRDTERPSTMSVKQQPQDVASWMPLVLINPHVSHPQGEQIGIEGCLSVPEISADIRRAERVTVRAQTLEGATIEFECTGLLARAVQHELDHLNGILFIDRMDAATRASFAGKLKRLQQETEERLKAKPRKRRAVAKL